MTSNISYSFDGFNFTLIRCDGTIMKSSLASGDSQTKNKKFIGHVKRGYFYEGNFYAVGLKNNLIKTDINTNTSVPILNFSTIVDDRYKLWRVLFVAEKEILVSAYQYNDDEKQPISEQYTYFLFRIDLINQTAMDMSILDGENDFVSINNGALYYTNNSGEICSYVNGKNIRLGLRGRFPTLSPDGSIIAYVGENLVWTKVYILNLSTKEHKSVIKFLWKNSVYPLLTWSKEGALLAVANDSDILPKTIYIIDSKSNKIVKKIKKTHACAWFFE